MQDRVLEFSSSGGDAGMSMGMSHTIQMYTRMRITCACQFNLERSGSSNPDIYGHIPFFMRCCGVSFHVSMVIFSRTNR